MSLVPVGRYVRDLRASRERMIENALDWEHLPHLHAGSFAAIGLIAADARGWRAEVEQEAGGTLTIDLRLDERGWVTRTEGGGRTLSEIRTAADATGADSCSVTVDFLMPDVPEDRRASTGAFFVSLYERLYDEDERMMIARARVLRDGPRPGTRPVTLADGSVHQVPLACPHQGLPLEAEPDPDGVITCPWHGYGYDVRTRRCRPGWSQPPGAQ